MCVPARDNIKTIGPIVFCCIVLVGFLSCDNSLDPLNEEKGLYSIYGYLHLYNEVNYIRVKDLNKPLSEMNDDSIDAHVVFKNLANGDTEVLKDSVVSFDGVKTHNFGINMDLDPGTKYRVRVERSDGKQTSAVATTPPIANRSLTPSFGANCTTTVNLKFEPMRNRFALDLRMGFEFDNQIYWTRMNKGLIDAENQVRINFTPLEVIKEVFGGNNPAGFTSEKIYCSDLSDDKYRVRYTHFGPDLNINTISDTLSIPGGAGKFGALYNDSFTFKISTTAVCPPQPFEECGVN